MPHASIMWGTQRRPVRTGYGLSSMDRRDSLSMSLPPVTMDDLVRTSVDSWISLGPFAGLRGACSLARFNKSEICPKASSLPLMASCKISSPFNEHQLHDDGVDRDARHGLHCSLDAKLPPCPSDFEAWHCIEPYLEAPCAHLAQKVGAPHSGIFCA
jgi:hypothetical protein